MHALRPIARILAAIAVTSVATLASAQSGTAWTDWKKETLDTMTGRLMLASGAVTVKFTGPQLYFTQLGEPGNRDYWISGDPDPYSVTGRPIGTDIVGFTGGTGDAQYKITFSRPVTDPVLAILSLGSVGSPARYVFNQLPTLVSSGEGFYGGCADCLKVKRKTVTGTEGHGVVRFVGTYKSITWTEPDYENWHGVTIGAPQEQ